MVGWVYLATALSGAALVANAAWPRTGPVGLFPSWLAALLTIDLAPQHTVLALLASAVFVWAGALQTAPGQIAGLLVAISVAGLLAIWWPARQAGATVAAAATSLGLRPAPPPPRGLLAAPFQRCRTGVRITRDQEFFRVAGRSLKLDVYQPVQAGEARPALIYVHGGAWMFGDKRHQGLPVCNHLAALGWVCFNINHRLSPGATYPDHVVDCKAAVAWVREHARDYGVNPDFIALAGGSSGAHIASMTALTAGDPTLQPGFGAADTCVQAVVTSYGVYDLTNRLGLHHDEFFSRLIGPLVIKAFPDTEPERFSAASPLDHAAGGTMPWLIIHGEADALAPAAEARDFAAALRQHGNHSVGYVELPKTLHGFDVWYSHRALAAIELSARFLNTAHGLAGRSQVSAT